MNWFRQEVAKAQRGDFKTAKPITVPTAPPPPPAPQMTDRQLIEAIYELVKAKS